MVKLNLIAEIFVVLVNCEWSNWSPLEPCSKTCDGGNQKHTRNKTVEENHFGTCSGSTEKDQSCNSQVCPGELFFTIYCQIVLHQKCQYA